MTTLKQQLQTALGAKYVLDAQDAIKAYLVEERDLYQGACALVLRPGTTAEVAEAVRLCAEHNVAIVPQGGNTGLCGGAVPVDGQVILSLTRLDRVRDVDPVNLTITVEAGCTLARVQEAAEQADAMFPLSLPSEGTCQIGGNLSTNAGGTGVLRYGNARELVLGIEAVLADGRVWNGLRRLRKNNTGYDLKHLFVGSEGTLGVITAAVLKLFPRPRDVRTAMAGVKTPADALTVLTRARKVSGDQVTAFELAPRIGMEMVIRHIPNCADPFTEPHPYYALIELSSSREDADLQSAMENLLEAALTDDLIQDAVIAASGDQRNALWRIREYVGEAQKHDGASIKHDVAVPVSRTPEFLARATEAVEKEMPGVRVVAFGHLGDGNIHYNLSQPVGADKQTFLDQWERMNRIVHDIVLELDGSFSAEHGIGRLKLGEMAHYKDPLEMDLMRRIKAVLDPKGLLNPGKVLPPE